MQLSYETATKYAKNDIHMHQNNNITESIKERHDIECIGVSRRERKF